MLCDSTRRRIRTLRLTRAHATTKHLAQQLALETTMSVTTPMGQPGWPAAAFDLPGTDGRRHTHESVRGANGTVIMFICNHCPVREGGRRQDRPRHDRIARARRRQHRDHEQRSRGVSRRLVREDEGVRARARVHVSVRLRRNAGRRAHLRRRVHARFLRLRQELPARLPRPARRSGRSPDPTAKRELFDAMVSIARSGKAPEVQHPSVGCSIKWQRWLGARTADACQRRVDHRRRDATAPRAR